jgi:hypothetical protein
MTDCAAQALRVWQKLQLELEPFMAQRRHKPLISECTLLTELNWANVRGLRQDAQKALLWFAMGRYPGIVQEAEAPVAEVVRWQALGFRPIGLGGSKDQFALHDLCHLAKFRGDLARDSDRQSYIGQVGFFHFLWANWDIWSAWAEDKEFAYALADMNGNPLFLWKTLFARWSAASKVNHDAWSTFRKLLALPLPASTYSSRWPTAEDWQLLCDYAAHLGAQALKSSSDLVPGIIPAKYPAISAALTN